MKDFTVANIIDIADRLPPGEPCAEPLTPVTFAQFPAPIKREIRRVLGELRKLVRQGRREVVEKKRSERKVAKNGR